MRQMLSTIREGLRMAANRESLSGDTGERVEGRWSASAIFIGALLGAVGTYQIARCTQAYAEESRLDIPSLNKSNYRQIINLEPACIIMYYRDDRPDVDLADKFVKKLIEQIPKYVKFYKINITSWTQNEKKNLVETDLGEDKVPSIITYKYGKYVTRARGSPREKDHERYLKGFLKEFE